jgi:hypothetical protein
MGKPKGKTPSLLSMATGTPEPHICGKGTPCDRCGETVSKGTNCFRIPKMKSGFTSKPIFCVNCTVAIVAQTKTDLGLVEQAIQQSA